MSGSFQPERFLNYSNEDKALTGFPQLPEHVFVGSYSTWVAVDVHFRRAGGWSGKDALLQRFGGCGVLGLFNAGTFCLPYLLPKCQLHGEDLQQRSGTRHVRFSSHPPRPFAKRDPEIWNARAFLDFFFFFTHIFRATDSHKDRISPSRHTTSITVELPHADSSCFSSYRCSRVQRVKVHHGLAGWRDSWR